MKAKQFLDARAALVRAARREKAIGGQVVSISSDGDGKVTFCTVMQGTYPVAAHVFVIVRDEDAPSAFNCTMLLADIERVQVRNPEGDGHIRLEHGGDLLTIISDPCKGIVPPEDFVSTVVGWPVNWAEPVTGETVLLATNVARSDWEYVTLAIGKHDDRLGNVMIDDGMLVGTDSNRLHVVGSGGAPHDYPVFIPRSIAQFAGWLSGDVIDVVMESNPSRRVVVIGHMGMSGVVVHVVFVPTYYPGYNHREVVEAKSDVRIKVGACALVGALRELRPEGMSDDALAMLFIQQPGHTHDGVLHVSCKGRRVQLPCEIRLRRPNPTTAAVPLGQLLDALYGVDQFDWRPVTIGLGGWTWKCPVCETDGYYYWETHCDTCGNEPSRRCMVMPMQSVHVSSSILARDTVISQVDGVRIDEELRVAFAGLEGTPWASL